MRIILVNDYPLDTGFGAEVQFAQLADGLRASGDSVEVFAGRPRKGVEKLLDVWDPFARRALKKLEESFRPDVVHFCEVIRELSTSVLGAPRRAARVLTIQDHRLLGTPDLAADRRLRDKPLQVVKRVKARGERIVVRRSVDSVIALTKTMAEKLRRFGFGSVSIVPPFITSVPEPTLQPSDSQTIFFAGRMGADKGVGILIDAFSRLTDRYPDTRLVLAGSGEDEQRFRAEAARAVGDRARFLGSLSNDMVREEMLRARFVVAPTLMAEVAPTVALEAAHAGRPVIATDDPGFVELLGHGDFGIIVPRGDVDALAGAMTALWDDPSRCDRMGREARATALATWTPEVGVARTHEVYAQALKRAHTRTSRG